MSANVTDGLPIAQAATNEKEFQPEKPSLDLACIGNCAYSALVDKKGQVVWSCYPRFDGDPIFCSLLKLSNTYSNDIGFFDIVLAHCSRTEQQYVRNTAVLSTKLYDESENAIEIVDLIPRFESHEREYRPNMLIRIVKPLSGRPRARIRLRPTFGYGWGTPEKTRGSNHIRYLLSNMTIRLTTNAPISYVVDEVLFEIDEPIYLILMPDESLKAPINQLAESYLQKTEAWWVNWSKNLTLPFEWQDEIIRAAITMKMGNFEETGAIVAAMTTSVPNSPAGGNYDYRYCWLQDATLVVHALNQLGATSTLEGYLKFLNNVVATFHDSRDKSGERRISAVYGVSMETRLHEREMHRLPGYHGIGPVRLGNKDSEIVNNDVYGAVILALTQMFFDRRLLAQGDIVMFNRMELLGEAAARVYNQPTSTRTSNSVQVSAHASVKCWAACDRLAKIASRLGCKERELYWSQKAKMIKDDIMQHIWNQELNSFVCCWDGQEVDSMLLALPEVGFVSYTDQRFLNSLAQIERTLVKNGMVLSSPKQTVSNTFATFRYIRALAEVGRKEDARKLFVNMLNCMNSVGLLSETIDPETKELWGNFPQNVSMVGLIDCAVILSKQWKDAF